MPAPNIQIDDLILYFKTDDDKDAYRLIPEDVYKNENLRLKDLKSAAPGWEGAILAEVNPNTEDEYYVANLSRLIDPFTTNFKHEDSKTVVPKLKDQTPGAKDLVIIPYDDPENGYLIKRDFYVDVLEPIDPEDIPDINFMATEEGVVLANIRKFEQTGISCYLINLQGLRRPDAAKRAKRPRKPKPTGEKPAPKTAKKKAAKKYKKKAAKKA